MRDEDALPVGDLVAHACRLGNRLRAAVAHRENREDLRLDHPLPESAQLLTPDNGDEPIVYPVLRYLVFWPLDQWQVDVEVYREATA